MFLFITRWKSTYWEEDVVLRSLLKKTYIVDNSLNIKFSKKVTLFWDHFLKNLILKTIFWDYFLKNPFLSITRQISTLPAKCRFLKIIFSNIFCFYNSLDINISSRIRFSINFLHQFLKILFWKLFLSLLSEKSFFVYNSLNFNIARKMTILEDHFFKHCF